MTRPSSKITHQTRFRVRYAETDQMGVVYYANYLVWMELGRAEYCRAAGIRYRDMEVGRRACWRWWMRTAGIFVRHATTKRSW